MRSVTLVLEGATARWMVTLHNMNAPELRNFDQFMTALCRQFKDPLADSKARDCIKTMCQGLRVVAEYTEEFCDLACRLNDWLEDILISCFKDGVNNDLYNACVPCTPPQLICHMAVEVEIDQACNKYSWPGHGKSHYQRRER